jgi:hypothetical protein
MTPTGYTEDALIEQPAIALLAELGWDTVMHSESLTTAQVRWAARPGQRSSSPFACTQH